MVEGFPALKCNLVKRQCCNIYQSSFEGDMQRVIQEDGVALMSQSYGAEGEMNWVPNSQITLTDI